MFSIDRVFRNETVDATHLAEFHQVEGVIADRGLTLGDLIGERDSKYTMGTSSLITCLSYLAGFMETFFKKMGLENLRFKSTYNPYTEVRKRWTDILLALHTLNLVLNSLPSSRPSRSTLSTLSSRNGSKSATAVLFVLK